MKIPFNVKFRPQIESGEYKVETRDGRTVRVLCWDRAAKEDQPKDLKLCVLVPENGGEAVYYYYSDGTKWVKDACFDLFIVTPESELTAWQRFISSCLQKHGLLDCGVADRIAKECSAELLDLARKELREELKTHEDYKDSFIGLAISSAYERGKAEALKDLPRWKKVGADTGQINLYKGFLRTQNYLEVDGRRIMLSELEKLPGFKED